ncbi:MAG TPA: choice-of-anchor Q domain-containing protein, partial [Verrucomicrobiae bacterium]|nr:choice-of-anchor Q domain-containing protein [Verrucomicrobiae bacterium]
TSPWLTIQHAANSVKAGDTVYVRAGVYKEVVSIPSSGSASGGYITFSSYPGELATVDGTGLAIPNSQWGLVTIETQSYIIIHGFEIRNYSTSKAADVPIGIYIFGSGTNIQITNNHIHHIATTAKGCAANAFGMTVYGTQAPASIDNLIVSGNEIDHTTTGCSETLSVDGNVENFTITNNLIHDDNNIAIGAIGYEGVSQPKGAMCGTELCDRARNGEISLNTVYNITSNHNPAYGSGSNNHSYGADGIYIDGGTQITIERNLVHNTDIGIEMSSENPGGQAPGVEKADHITARNNVVYQSNSVGITIGGYAKGKGGTDHCYIVNNTLYDNDTAKTGEGEFQIQWYATNNTFENNILYAGAQNVFLYSYTTSEPSPAAMDYNLYYSTGGAANGNWEWQAKNYTGYSTYLSKTGNDSHSPPFLNPEFISLRSPPNLDIQPASPAVNAGTNLGASIVGTVDFAGNPRTQGGAINIGAFEK